jgi:hypothetical protein
MMRFLKIGPARWIIVSVAAKRASRMTSAAAAIQGNERFRGFGVLERENKL